MRKYVVKKRVVADRVKKLTYTLKTEQTEFYSLKRLRFFFIVFRQSRYEFHFLWLENRTQ